MNKIISKELLSEVLEDELKKECSLNYRITAIRIDKPNVGIEYIDSNNFTYTYKINIHELAHRCKEWALKQGYDIIIVEIDNKYCILTEDCWQDTRDKKDKSFVVSETFKPQNTEPEAIYKACQFIYDNERN